MSDDSSNIISVQTNSQMDTTTSQNTLLINDQEKSD